MYAAMLEHPKFTVPMQEGKFATISQQEMDAMLLFKYGIYKCRITNPDKVSTRLFHYSDARDWAVHHDDHWKEKTTRCSTLMGERGRRSRAAKKNHALSVGGLTTPNNTEVDLNKEKRLDLQHREITHMGSTWSTCTIICQRYNLYRLCSAGPVPHIVCTTADVPHRMYTVCTRMGW